MVVPKDSAQGMQRLFKALSKSDRTSWETGLELKVFSDLKTPSTRDKSKLTNGYER